MDDESVYATLFGQGWLSVVRTVVLLGALIAACSCGLRSCKLENDYLLERFRIEKGVEP